MTNDEVKSLHRVLDYLKEVESHFESCSSKEKREHIFKDVLVLRDFEKRVNMHNNRLAVRNVELRKACKLAYIHLKKYDVGASAMKAIEDAIREK